MYPRQRVGAVRIQLRGTQHLPEELEWSTFTAPEDLAYVGRNPTGKRKAMELRQIMEWTQAIFLGIALISIVIFMIVAGVPMLAFLMGDAVDGFLGRIFASMTWPKRQLDRRRFTKEFDLNHWGYKFESYLASHRYISYRPRDGVFKVDAVLGPAADRLQEAFDRENTLQRTAATQMELKVARKKTKVAKNRFWYLHDLASRVVNYPDCYKCSYADHLVR